MVVAVDTRSKLQIAKQVIWDRLGYLPNAEQRLIHDSPARFRLVAGGEQAGKSFVAAQELIGRCVIGELYWLVGADYEQCRREWQYLEEGFSQLGILVSSTQRVDPGEMVIGTRAHIVTRSAKDPKKLGREAPDGILGCEASLLEYEAWLRIRGRAAPKRAWVLLTGSFETSLGWFPELFKRWQGANEDEAASFSLPTWTNVALYPGGRDDPEIKRLEAVYPKERFLERFCAVPCPPTGLVFSDFRVTVHVQDVQNDPTLPVYLWIDPGYAGAYAVEVVQVVGDQVRVIDEVYEQGLVTQEVITVCQQRPWWSQVRAGTVDIAARQHQAMPAVAEVWQKEGRLTLAAQSVKINEGIERLKSFIKVNPLSGQPGILIAPKCRGLISELGGGLSPIDGQTRVYKWHVDSTGVATGSEPEDKNNHAIKAVIYGLVDRFGFVSRTGNYTGRSYRIRGVG